MNGIKTLMVLISATLLLAACKTLPEKKVVEVLCKEPRPQMCTMIYQPVCGVDQEGQFKTYSSGCNACSHSEVVGYNPNACEDAIKKQMN